MGDGAALFRFCPGCGVAAPKDWDARCFRCSACGFSLWFNASASVSAIVTDARGRILVLVRSREPRSGFLTLPGGFVEPGEDAVTALRREVSEEIGVALGDLHWVAGLPNVYRYGGVEYPTLDLVFHARLDDPDAIVLSDESSEYAWVDPADLHFSRFAFPSLSAAVELFAGTRRR